MGFTVAQSTLESLEWSRVIEALRMSCRTPQGRLRLEEVPEASLFETSEEGVRSRLRETSEARTLLDQESIAPLGGSADLREAISHADKGGVLEPAQLIDVRTTLEVLHAISEFFERRSEEFPTLAALALQLESLDPLAREIARCVDTSGEVRDSASSTLAQARREARKISGNLQERIERALHHTEIAPHLSDQFYTVRNGRFVLPVKADAKGQVRGIVHDASRSGTTLYVEPDGMVELNNRHRQAELTIEREVLRVLRELSAAVARDSGALGQNLETLAVLDLAFARGALSKQLDAVEPRVENEGVFELPGLRHPLIPTDECVANDLRVGRDFSVLILSGPNAGGKTVAMKSIALAALFVRAGLHVPADPGARIDLTDLVLADIGDHQDIRESLSTFSAAMANLAEILRSAGTDTLVCLDEIGVGTDPSEGAAIAQATLEALAESGARTVTTTHYNLLKEMAEVDDRFENASVEFDPETLAPTYRVRIGAPGASSATTVAARMGLSQGVLDRAAALLDREDRRLDRMLVELSASRALLETEQATAHALRLEGEQAREEYRAKLARLQERRDKLFGEMRNELDESFREAHSEVARIIAELQREPSSRRAASARARLEVLRQDTNQAQIEQGIAPDEEPAAPDAPSAQPIDWPHARVGDLVIAPGGARGTLLSLPDRKGRVFVQAAGAKLRLRREQLAAPEKGNRDAPTRSGSRKRSTSAVESSTTTELSIGGTIETDLRGLRVDEAIERVDTALDLAVAEGRAELRIIHGIGTGALRRAIREHLGHSRYEIEWLEASREEGGAGATRVLLGNG